MTGLREPSRPVFSDVEVVFEAHAKFAIDADHRLIREAHSWRQRCLVAFDQISPLVYVQKWLGHNDIIMTQRYAHLAPESLEHAVNTLEEAAWKLGCTH